jgi:hypothetical protein
MIDPQARPAPYIKLMALVVVLGLICALITFAFMALVLQGTNLLWEPPAQALGLSAPIFLALFVAVWVQHEAGPVIAIAVIVGLLATARLSLTPA